MEVRRLHPNDAELARQAIGQLKVTDAALQRLLTLGYIRRFLKEPENVLIVATDGDTPIGFLLAYLLGRMDRDRRMMFFYEIEVAEPLRRQGVGTAMVELLKSVCRELKVMKMWVHTNRSNSAAIALYRATGGRPDPSGDEVTFGYGAESFGGSA